MNFDILQLQHTLVSELHTRNISWLSCFFKQVMWYLLQKYRVLKSFGVRLRGTVLNLKYSTALFSLGYGTLNAVPV